VEGGTGFKGKKKLAFHDRVIWEEANNGCRRAPRSLIRNWMPSWVEMEENCKKSWERLCGAGAQDVRSQKGKKGLII